MIGAGIDAGSRSIKIVLFDSEQSRILTHCIADQGVKQSELTEELFLQALKNAQVARQNVAQVIATGYGRKSVGFADTTITEITCHATGIRHVAPDVRTIIEIGGQDSKVISLDNSGKIRDFSMNDRCAAGSGRFLEVVASRLDVNLNALGLLSQSSRNPAEINSMCVVFAESEIIGLLAEGTEREDIAAGVQNAMARRVGAMAPRLLSPPVYFTGGVALQHGMVRALEAVLGSKICVPSLPQYTGALGAAILAIHQAS